MAGEFDAHDKVNWHWRNSMRPVRFFNLDARAVIPFFALLVYARLVTLFVCVLVTVIFKIVESRGMTFPGALRAVRSAMAGRKRPAWISLRRKRFIDYG